MQTDFSDYGNTMMRGSISMHINTALVPKATFHIMIEGDKAENNYSAYIPELRLGAIGDTVEEAKENAICLAKLRIEQDQKNLQINKDLIYDTFELDI